MTETTPLAFKQHKALDLARVSVLGCSQHYLHMHPM